uniref:RING-type domain-containing protein n=1 Tax=Erpetoichthys calabaricus TaxID=27687 RepID=A0A8C4SIA1_ERPCA
QRYPEDLYLMAESQSSAPECPICFQPYNNAFRMPLKLPVCSHTFCLQCLCQICLFLKPSQTFLCPLCRTSTSVPVGGAPQFLLPAHQRSHICRVWMEGSELCHWRLQPPSAGFTYPSIHYLTHFPVQTHRAPVAILASSACKGEANPTWCHSMPGPFGNHLAKPA